MKKLVIFCFLTVLSFSCWAQETPSKKKDVQEQSLKNKSKIGIYNKFLITSTQGSGLLYGWRYINYNSEKFFMGGAGFTGQVYSGGLAASMTYGGLLMGYDWHFGEKFKFLDFLPGGKKFELSILFGSASGSSTAKTNGGMLIEPSASYVMSLGERTKSNIGLSYIYIPGSEDYRGFTVSFTFDILYSN